MIAVLVVDDSALIRRLITEALAADPGIRVVGTAANGRLALEKIDKLAPDLVTLDLEMPVMDGLQTLRAIRRTRPTLPVVMFSTLTAAGATATLDALAAGASDYVTKPSNTGSFAESQRSVREQLIPRIHALCERRSRTATPARRAPAAVRVTAPTRAPAAAPARRPAGRVDVVAVGCSTGGPAALAHVVARLPQRFPAPVVVVQHMPPVFTRMFAERLDRESALRVVEATDGQPVQAGTVYVAPGDRHLEVVRRGAAVVTRLHGGPAENYCRPAVDVLFRSVAKVYGSSTVAVVLTGMGQDGRRGCEELHAAGADIVVQDEVSSVVWGMPGAVAAAGLASAVLTLDEVASHLINRAGRAEKPEAVTSWR